MKLKALYGLGGVRILTGLALTCASLLALPGAFLRSHPILSAWLMFGMVLVEFGLSLAWEISRKEGLAKATTLAVSVCGCLLTAVGLFRLTFAVSATLQGYHVAKFSLVWPILVLVGIVTMRTDPDIRRDLHLP